MMGYSLNKRPFMGVRYYIDRPVLVKMEDSKELKCYFQLGDHQG